MFPSIGIYLNAENPFYVIVTELKSYRISSSFNKVLYFS